MNPYEILKTLAPLGGISAQDGGIPEPIKHPRHQKIQQLLPSAGLEIDEFSPRNAQEADPDPSQPRFLNYYFTPWPRDPKKLTRVLGAHHDVVDPQSENVLDNTASVAHLIALARSLAGMVPGNFNLVIALVDAEETCSFTSSGSARLARQIFRGRWGPVELCINLELTAGGTHLAVNPEGPGTQVFPQAYAVPMPMGDHVILAHHGLSALTVTLLNPLRSLVRFPQGARVPAEYWDLAPWYKLHGPQDGLHLAVPRDMEAFHTQLLAAVYGSKVSNQASSWANRGSTSSMTA